MTKSELHVLGTPNDSHAEMRSSGQLALIAGAYACSVGCGTVVLVESRQPLPMCPVCRRRTSWLRQRTSEWVPTR